MGLARSGDVPVHLRMLPGARPGLRCNRMADSPSTRGCRAIQCLFGVTTECPDPDSCVHLMICPAGARLLPKHCHDRRELTLEPGLGQCAVRCHSVRLAPVGSVEFATVLLPNSPERREDPVLWTGPMSETHGLCLSHAFSSSCVRRGRECARMADRMADPSLQTEGRRPQRRENPATGAGSRLVVLGFPKRRGGDSNPRYRLRGTTVFETAALSQLCHLSVAGVVRRRRE